MLLRFELVCKRRWQFHPIQGYESVVSGPTTQQMWHALALGNRRANKPEIHSKAVLIDGPAQGP